MSRGTPIVPQIMSNSDSVIVSGRLLIKTLYLSLSGLTCLFSIHLLYRSARCSSGMGSSQSEMSFEFPKR
jgi:hypothetical protein